MEPREHHHFFAKQMIPTHTFRSPDQVFGELTGPKREAFLMYLWTEAGKGMAQPLRNADVGKQPGSPNQGVVKLDVVGAVRHGWTEVVVISMPPAIAPNEAIFIALVREGGNVRIFFFERCANQAGGVSENEAVLAGVTADGTRSNYGFFPSDGLEAFKTELGKVLNVSLAGLETSLPPVTMAAFMGPGITGLPSMQKSSGVGGVLEKMLIIRAAMPLFFYFVNLVTRGLLGRLTMLLYPLFSIAIIITFFIWIYGIFDARRGKTSYSPGMAIGGWFIPFANFVLPPLTVRDAWKAVRGPEGSAIVFVWWMFYLMEMSFRILYSFGFGFIPPYGGREEGAMMLGSSLIPLDPTLASLLSTIVPLTSMLIGTCTYALWWHIVRRINEKA